MLQQQQQRGAAPRRETGELSSLHYKHECRGLYSMRLCNVMPGLYSTPEHMHASKEYSIPVVPRLAWHDA